MHLDEVGIYVTKDGYIHLTKTENFLLKVLIENKGKVVTYEMIGKTLYNSEIKECCANSIRTAIVKLRKKLKDEVIIKTKKGRGYYIDY